MKLWKTCYFRGITSRVRRMTERRELNIQSHGQRIPTSGGLRSWIQQDRWWRKQTRPPQHESHLQQSETRRFVHQVPGQTSWDERISQKRGRLSRSTLASEQPCRRKWGIGTNYLTLARIAGRKTNRPSASARALQPEIVSCTSEKALAPQRLYVTTRPELLTDRDLCTLLIEGNAACIVSNLWKTLETA